MALCSDGQPLVLYPLPRRQIITEAASELLLACNRDTLQSVWVESPLTEDPRGILYKLPKLRHLWTLVPELTSLSPVSLPDLEMICVVRDSGHDWLQGFRGATIGKLKTIIFQPAPGSLQIGDLLEEFQSVPLTTSAQTSLSEFGSHTSQSWTPSYSSLLGFKHVTMVVRRRLMTVSLPA